MTYSVAVYHASVPSTKNKEKVELLKRFAQGIRAHGDPLIEVNNTVYHGAEDVSVIQGWISDEPATKGHQLLRKTVVSQQLKRKKYVVAVDSNLFLYANTANPLHYLRYSFNGVFPNTGIYCDTEINPLRWTKISRDLNISLKDYRTNGNHILICLQRNGGWSMGNTDVMTWLGSTISQLRKHSGRPIVVRPHPGDKQATVYMKSFVPPPGVTISQPGRPLIDDLQNCWAAVNHNSSPVVGAAIEGVPIFVTDPARSQCAEIANTSLSLIERPTMPDRLAWVQRLSMFHWKFDELTSGECWMHMRDYLANVSQR